MIKAIIFDVGGVLLRTHDPRYRLEWDKKLSLADGTLEHLVFNSEAGTQAQRGRVSEEEHWRWIGQEVGLSADDLLQFRQEFWYGDQLDTGLIAYIHRLRPSYQTAIISNAMDGTRQVLNEINPIADAFDLIVISAEEKVMKPDPAIFLRTLERLGRRPEEAVFIDDFIQNVTAAREVGMAAIHFTADSDLSAALAQLGVKPDETINDGETRIQK